MFHAPAYIFDFDGVIADSMSMHMSAWSRAHQEIFGRELMQIQRIAGLDSIKIARKLALEAQMADQWELFLAKKRSLVLELVDTIELLPGAKDFLSQLQKSKVPHGICTNANKAFIERVLGNHKIPIPLHITVDMVARPKPHPEPYLKTVELLEVPLAQQSDVIVFEDSRHGLRAAKDAGLYCIGLTTIHSKEELISAGAKKVYETLEMALRDLPLNP
ncbi:MAG: HAD family phosphatase [Pseudomonadota bacterium]